MPNAPRFTVADIERAYEEWGANCGPAAIAAIAGLTLTELRPHLGDFETKRYTNPTLMWTILDSLQLRWRRQVRPLALPRFGLARIQWEGPWTAPGVPPAAAYRHTHWIGVDSRQTGATAVFDVNAMSNGTGWCRLEDWETILVPWILKEAVPRANGRWHITHGVEIEVST